MLDVLHILPVFDILMSIVEVKMKVNIDFAMHIDVIEFEPFMKGNIEDYQRAFEKWYYEEYTEVIEGKKLTCMRQRANLPYKYFGVEVVIDWINEVAPSSNPRILERNLGRKEYDSSLPSMCF